MGLQEKLEEYTKGLANVKFKNATEYAIGDLETLNDVCKRVPFEITHENKWNGKLNISFDDFQDFTAFDYTEMFPDSIISFEDFMCIVEEKDLGDYTIEDLLGTVEYDDRYSTLFKNSAVSMEMYNLNNEYFGKLNLSVDIQFENNIEFDTLEPEDKEDIIFDICTGIYDGIYDEIYFNYAYVIDFPDGNQFIGTSNSIKALLDAKDVNDFKVNVYSNPEISRIVGEILNNETLLEIADTVDNLQHFEFGISLEDRIQDAENKKNNQDKTDKKPGKDDLEK